MPEEPDPACRVSDCGHGPNWHGRRAGVDPGRCHHPGCQCQNWQAQAVPTRIPRLCNPAHDRDLFLGWQQALGAAIHGDDPDAGYRIMMAEIFRWQCRILGVPVNDTAGAVPPK